MFEIKKKKQRKFRKKIFGRYEKMISCLEKRNTFRKSKIENSQKKKNETKRRRKPKGVSQRDEKKRMKKATKKKRKDLAKK